MTKNIRMVCALFALMLMTPTLVGAAQSMNMSQLAELLNRLGIITPMITISSPSVGARFTKGSEVTLAWKARYVSGKLSLALQRKDGTIARQIAKGDIDPGFEVYHWLAEEGLADGDYRFVLSSTNDALGYSPYFSLVTEIPDQTVVILSPNGGKDALITRGSSQTVRWKSSRDTGALTLVLKNQNGSTQPLATLPSHIGQNTFEWPVSKDQPAGTYKIALMQGSTLLDESDGWFIIYNAHPVVTNIVPARVQAGSVVTVNGAGFSNGENTIHIKNASSNYAIRPTTQSPTQLTFTVPKWIGGDYQLSVERDYELEGTALDFSVVR